MKIALRSPNWVGDCVMALPAISAMKKAFPDSEIFVVTKRYLKSFFQNIIEIDGVVTIPDKFSIIAIKKISKEMNINGFEIGVLFTNSFLSALLFKMAGVKKNYGYNRDLRSFLLNNKMKYPQNEKHHRFFYLDLINKIFNKNFTDISINLISFTDKEKALTKEKMAKIGLKFGKKIIGLSTFAAYGSSKAWPSEMFTELIKKLQKKYRDLQFVLLGSKKESSKISAVIDGIEKSRFNFAGLLSLRESMVAVSFCDVFVSNDSGLMHLADTLNVPLTAIFGPTSPHKTKPISEKSEILYEKVSCSPCKHRECPIDHRCMKKITVEMVYKSVLDKIK